MHGVWSIPEDARISVLLETRDRANEFGTPLIYIGDVVYELSLHSSVNGKKSWHLLFDDDQFSGMPFFNYVGRSEIILAFSRSELRIKNLVDIQASVINAELAESMLSYLHAHYESIVALCFSRSRLACSSGDGCEDSLNRLINEAQSGIELCERVWDDILRKVRETWRTRLRLGMELFLTLQTVLVGFHNTQNIFSFVPKLSRILSVGDTRQKYSKVSMKLLFQIQICSKIGLFMVILLIWRSGYLMQRSTFWKTD